MIRRSLAWRDSINLLLLNYSYQLKKKKMAHWDGNFFCF